jgi:putative membrane protein
MLVVHPIQELIRAVPALAGLLVAGNSSGHGSLWSLAGVAVVVALGLVRWFTTTYRITEEQVQVRRGLLRRRVLAVPRDRVRTVDVTANPLHRVLGLARLTVGTGRSDRKNEDGLRLDALLAAEASRVRVELLHRGPAPAAGAPAGSGTRSDGTGRPVPTPPAAGAVGGEVELARLEPGWVRYGPFTLSGLVTVGVVAAVGSRTLSEANIDPGRVGPLRRAASQLSGLPLWLAVVEVVLGLVVAVAAASTAGYVLAFWRFRLTRQPGGTLHVTRGLVTTRSTTIEERRLRGVEISEPLLLRAVRGARCIAIATGLRVGRGAERGGSLLLPPAPRGQAQRVAAAVLGSAEPVRAALARHGLPARRRRYTRALTGAVLLTAAAAALHGLLGLPGWVWQTSLLLPPAGALLAADRYRSLGHALVGGTLVTGWGSLVRRRCALACDGVIGWNLRQSFFQRRAGVATLVATTAAGKQAYRVTDVPLAEALRVADQGLPGLLTPFLT